MIHLVRKQSAEIFKSFELVWNREKEIIFKGEKHMGLLNKLGKFLTEVDKKLDEKLAEYEKKEQENAAKQKQETMVEWEPEVVEDVAIPTKFQPIFLWI